LILGNIDKFQSNKSWRFIDKNYEFLDASNPLSEQFPEEYQVIDLATNMKVDFVGVKVGDVSGNVTTNNLTQSEVRSSLPLRWESNVTTTKGSNIIAVEITSENFERLNGFQTTLQFQNSEMEFIGVEGVKIDLSQNNIGKKYLNRGLIAMSWSSPYLESAGKEEVLFKLFFKLIGEEVGSIGVNSSMINTEVYFENEISNNIQLVENIDDVLLVDQNAPNPWTEKTEIRFESNMDNDVLFSVYDLFGKLVHKESLSAKAGVNSVSLDRSDIVSSGIYLYELSSRGKKVINKMIIID